MQIGPQTIEKTVKAIETMLENHMVDLDRIYQDEGEELAVSISVKFFPSAKKPSDTMIKYKISYSKGKVSEEDLTIATEG